MGKFNLSTILITSIILSGCSGKKPPSFELLDDVLEPTETVATERTPEWYSEQELIRKEVISACFSHFEEKSKELGNEYEMQFIENYIKKFEEFPDCINAHDGNLLALSKNNTRIYKHEVEEVKQNISDEKSQAEIEAQAQALADRLSRTAESGNIPVELEQKQASPPHLTPE